MFPAYFPLLANFLNTLPDIEQQLSMQTLLVNYACHAIVWESWMFPERPELVRPVLREL